MSKKNILLVGALALILVTAIGLPFTKFGLEGRTSAAYIKKNMGQIILNTASPVQMYGTAAGETLSLTLPKDADKNGFDSFVVQECKTVDGELWIGLYIGSRNSVWMPFSQVAGLNEKFPFNAGGCS